MEKYNRNFELAARGSSTEERFTKKKEKMHLQEWALFVVLKAPTKTKFLVDRALSRA